MAQTFELLYVFFCMICTIALTVNVSADILFCSPSNPDPLLYQDPNAPSPHWFASPSRHPCGRPAKPTHAADRTARSLV